MRGTAGGVKGVDEAKSSSRSLDSMSIVTSPVRPNAVDWYKFGKKTRAKRRTSRGDIISSCWFRCWRWAAVSDTRGDGGFDTSAGDEDRDDVEAAEAYPDSAGDAASGLEHSCASDRAGGREKSVAIVVVSECRIYLSADSVIPV